MTTGTTKGNFSKYRSYHLLGLSHQLIYQNNKLIFLQIYLLWSKFFIVLLSLSYLFEKYKVYTSEVVRCIITGDYQFKIDIFCLQKDQNRHNLTDTQTGRQTDREGSSPGITVTSFPCLVWTSPGMRSECLEGSSYSCRHAPALSYTWPYSCSCRGSTVEPVAFTQLTLVLDETERGASDFLI